MEKRTEMILLFEKGMSFRDIAKAYSITIGEACRMIKGTVPKTNDINNKILIGLDDEDKETKNIPKKRKRKNKVSGRGSCASVERMHSIISSHDS